MLVAVAYSVRSEEEGGVVTVFVSLLAPVDPEDELAWLKWPMTVGGVLVFVLFKLFGARNKTPKPNTPGGTFSKYGRYHDRFSAGGDSYSTHDLKQLREKLSEIENT